MFKNDERYWDINLLNKWFAISSVVFLVVMVWVFIDDNDDEFKEYQREFRRLQIEKAEQNLTQEKSSIESEVEDYDKLLAEAENEYSDKSQEVERISKVNMTSLRVAQTSIFILFLNIGKSPP